MPTIESILKFLTSLTAMIQSLSQGAKKWLGISAVICLTVYAMVVTVAYLYAKPHPAAIVAQVTTQPREPPPSNPQWPPPADHLAKSDSLASIAVRTTVESPIAPVVAPVAAKADCPVLESPKPRKRAMNVSRQTGQARPTPLIGGQP